MEQKIESVGFSSYPPQFFLGWVIFFFYLDSSQHSSFLLLKSEAQAHVCITLLASAASVCGLSFTLLYSALLACVSC
jgi:hypothetical protein